MSSLKVHAVIVKKPIELSEAKRIAKAFIPPSRKYYRETSTSYRFRNIPKTKFDPDSFVSHVVNKNITIVLGRLK